MAETINPKNFTSAGALVGTEGLPIYQSGWKFVLLSAIVTFVKTALGLGDVVLADVKEHDILKYNGSEWVNTDSPRLKSLVITETLIIPGLVPGTSFKIIADADGNIGTDRI